MANYLRTLAVRQLQSVDSGTRLVVVHPNFIQQHHILGEIFDQISVYVRFEGNDLDYDELNRQYDCATGNYNPEGTILVLDECDRAKNTAFEDFLLERLNTKQSQRIFIFCRQFPGEWMRESPLWHEAAYLPIDENAMMWDYAELQPATPLLEVRSFGEGRVILNGRVIDQWDGVLPRSLFFYLVDRGMTTRSEIFETFWPNLSTREATNVFHVTKRKISEVLGIDLTTYWSGFYRISSDIQLSYDVIRFSEMLQNSAVSPLDEATTLLNNAVSLYRSDFLHSMDMKWARMRRQELRQDYADALESLAAASTQANQKHKAIGLYLSAAAISENRPDIITQIMQLYRDLNMHAEAINLYSRISTEEAVNNHVNGGASLENLMDSIRQEMG